MNTIGLDQTYIAATYSRFNVALSGGKGARLWDENGKTYIDLGSGIAVNTFGACDESWQQAVIKQVQTLQHTSNLYYTAPQTALAQRLCEKTGMDKVFFGNSGAEANECMLKVARKYSLDRYGQGRHVIVTLENSFHGRTMATLAATGQESFHRYFGPFPEGFRYVPPGDTASLERALSQGDVCAMMLELVQGEGGVVPLNQAFVTQAAKLCKQKDILMMVDEVQTGNGRTGKLYAYMHYGIEPDVVSTAKGLAGGLPMGACLMGKKVSGVLGAGDHGSTFGGNPVCAAGALSILERLDDDLLSQVTIKGDYIKKELEGAPGVQSLSGMGLMWGLETRKPAREIAAQCLEAGVLVLTAKEKVRLLPPLNIPWEDLKEAVDILKQVASI